MKLNTKNMLLKSLPLLTAIAGLTQGSNAQIVTYSSNFSATSGANSADGWVDAGSVAYTAIGRLTSTLDGSTVSLPGVDTASDDGYLRLDTADATSGNEIAAYTLSGTMQAGSYIRLELLTFNAFNSFWSANFAIYNLTDNRAINSFGLAAAGNTSNVYTILDGYVTAADAGDTLQIRFTENHSVDTRNICLDAVKVSQIPEPSAALLGGLGVLALLRRRR